VLSRSSSLEAKDRVLGWRMVVPALLLLLLVSVYPYSSILFQSFRDWNLVTSGDTVRFVGLQNYLKALMNRDFLHSVLRTFAFVAVVLPLEFVVGLFLALLLNHRDLKFKGLFRALLLLPMMLSPVVTAVVWNMIYSTQFGPLNYLLQVLGITDGRTEWLGNIHLAFPALAFATIWMWFPFSVLVLSAGLQGIPEEEYEAARIDGASFGQIFRFVTFPHLLSSILVILLIRFIDGLKTFALVYTLTKGGPGTATELIYFHIYEVAFRSFNISYASAMSMLLIIITLLGSLLVIRLGHIAGTGDT
jgi:multiple sugar transport system permease protein